MRGSFVKKGQTRSQDTGTRPGLHGQTLVSMGLVDFDRLLGGGLPLGSLTLILEDKHSQQHKSLLRYFLAEGVMTGQKALWINPDPPSGGPEAFLPATADPNERASSHSKASSSQSAQGGQQEQQELRIAWQYRKYLDQSQAQRSQAEAEWGSTRKSSSSSGASQAAATRRAVDAGVGREWCHAYDLTRSMDPERVKVSKLACASCERSLPAASAAALDFASSFEAPTLMAPGGFALPVAPKGPESVGRLVVQSLGSPVWHNRTTNHRPSSCVPSHALSGGGVPPSHSQSQPQSQPRSQPHSQLGGGRSGQHGEAPHEQHSQQGVSSSEQQQQQQVLGSGDGGGDDGDEEGEEGAWVRVARTLLQLHMAVQDKRCAAIVTCQAYLIPPSWQMRLQHLCDVVIALESISDASPVYKLLPDASSAAALLSVRKLPSAGMLGPRLPDPQLYVLRNKRRRMALTPVEVDPQAEEREQEALVSANTSKREGGQGAALGLDF